MAGPASTSGGQPSTPAPSPAPASAGPKSTPANSTGRAPVATGSTTGPAQTANTASAGAEKPSVPGKVGGETVQPVRKPVALATSARAISTAAGSPATPTSANTLPSTANEEVTERRMFREPGKSFGGPLTKEECEFWLSKLQDKQLDLSKRAMIASELRDSADATRDPAVYSVFLNTLIPPITAMLLETGPPVVFFREQPEQRFRNTLLAFLQRLPRTEPLKPHESSLMSTALSLLKVENEDNALLCIKIIIDGFRSHKEQTEQHVQPFLNLVKEMYANIKEVVEKEFGKPGTVESDAMQGIESAAPIQPQSQPVAPAAPVPPTTAPAAPSASAPAAGNPLSGNFVPATPSRLTPLPHALRSPKVLTECPIAVVLIFQSFRQVMQGAMKDFYPLVMDSIALQPEPQRKAYRAAEEKGQIFTGVAEGIHNREMYTEIIKAQVKTMAFLAYVLRGSIDNIRNYLDIFPEACVRLLRDCPPEDVATRKELLIATRHMLSSDFRTAFVPFIDMLLDEKVLVGSGVTSREALRPLAYSTLADLIHHVRNDLSLQQLVRVIAVYACISHDSTFPFSIQTMCSKLTQACIESICNKGDKAEAISILQGVLLTTVEKLKATYKAFDRMKQASMQDKGKSKPMEEEQIGRQGFDAYDWRSIERAMPVLTVAYASDSLDTFVRDAKTILRSLFNTFRSLFNNMRVIDAPSPQGDILGDLFRYGVLSLQIYEGGRDTREEKDAIEQLGMVLICFEPHVYSEVWTSNLSFYCKQLLDGPNIITLLQNMLVNNEVSHQTVGILLKHLMNNLESVGTQSKIEGALTLKLFKLSFMAVNQFIELNEPVLVPYLSKLIIDSFAYAAKAEDPAIYYQVLRALFRSIGGGRFEALYKEVLPILEEMLETLNYLLRHAEPSKRDLFVELCLTVPVRLTNLLPHLGYLMHPLVHALNSGPDLISQGLRTLELCIDNLTSEFLDPTLDPVLRELMTALYNLLKPVPFNHQQAHSAVKILGKLGGRNRKFAQTPYLLEFHPVSEDIVLQFDVEGQQQDFQIASWVELAARHVRNPAAYNRENAVTFLKQCSLLFVSSRYHSIEQEPVLRNVIKGLFEASIVEEQHDDVVEHIRLLAHEVFRLELQETARKQPKAGKRSSLSLRPSSFIQSIILAMADGMVNSAERMKELFEVIVKDLLAQKKEADDSSDSTSKDSGNIMIQMLFSRSFGLCFEEDWDRKLAGCAGLDILRKQEALEGKWLAESRKLDYVRGLFFVLRDAPKDTPKSLEEVASLLKDVIRQSSVDPQVNPSSMSKLIDMLVLELPSQKTAVRDAAKECIAILAEIKQVSVYDLISSSAKERLLDPASGPIFNKPLRALPFGMQIGNIDAITYLLNLTPSLPEVNEELNRLFHETIALADADDASLIGRQTHHALEVSLRSLRVACLKLLCAAMNCAELFANNQSSLRSRIISVYFKHMYSSSPQIVEVAHEGLKRVLAIQTKLPKDILQTGLRPILVNLADARRLSVSGLEGLARFLELLTNYFKVEIGVKLLDHFKSLAEPAMLTNAAARPYEDNQDIARMVRLVNIFRLLPPTANTFLRDLTEYVSDAEAKLLQSRPGPFTDNLALYFDKYPVDATAFLLDRLSSPQLVRTYRHTLESGKAPNFVAELSDQADKLCELCFRDQDKLHLVLPGIQIIDELSATSDDWLLKHVDVLQALVSVWRNLVALSKGPREESYSRVFSQEPTVILRIFMRYLEKHEDIELLFHVVEAFEIQSAVDRSDVTDFLYREVAASNNLQFKRNVFTHFFRLYENPDVSSAFKKNALRYIVNPLLWLHYSRRGLATKNENIIVQGVPAQIASTIWHPLISARHGGEDSLHIELLHMSAILVHYCPDVVGEFRKDIIMVAWESIKKAGDATVKHMAYLLAGRFFNAFESPPNIVRPTWHGLLRVKETEGRNLYRQAINLVARCLPKRDPPQPNQISWAAATKKVLTEEGNATPQLVSVCELLVGNPDLFYNSRDLFVSLMANSLTKLGFVPAATADMKKLTIDIVELIFRWERRRLTGGSPVVEVEVEKGEDTKKRAGSGENPDPKRQRTDAAGSVVSQPATSSTPRSTWELPVHVRELITSYLVRLVSTSPESISRGGLTFRAVQLLREIIGPDGLPGVTVKLSFFQRTMAQDITESNFIQVSNSCEVIAIVANSKDMDWIKAHLSTLMKLLESAVLSDFSPLHDTLRPLLERMFQCLPAPVESGQRAESVNDDVTAFHQWAENIAQSLNKPDKTLTAKDRLQGPLFVLQCYIKSRPERLAASAGSVVKLITKLTLDLTGANLQASVYENAHRSAIAIMELCRGHLAQLGDQRRPYLGALHHMIEHCTSIPMCRYILDMLRDWTLVKQDPLPAFKEKAGLLNRMITYESRRDEASGLYHDYLQLILDIFQEPSLARSDLTNRLEGAFLVGTRCGDPILRSKFIAMLEKSLPTDVPGRLRFILATQNWEHVAGTYWMTLATDLLYACIERSQQPIEEPVPQAEGQAVLVTALDARLLIKSFRALLPLDNAMVDEVWATAFQACWSSLERPIQVDVQRWFTGLICKEHHMEQVEKRPNGIQTLFRGALACGRAFLIPPLVIKYFGKTFGVWHTAMELLSMGLEQTDAEDLRDGCADALTEMYAELSEDDLFYGLWRRRCLHDETNAGLALEQNGLWPRAQEVYEQAQMKVRNGVIPYTENEYNVWQDHWIIAAQKLQQWDILTDLARHENNHDLLLECAWRLSDWGSQDREMIERTLDAVSDVPTPRRKVFQAYTCLIKAHTGHEDPSNFLRVLDEAIQLSMRKWCSLPTQLSAAHIPLLQMFQQYVELQEAAGVFESLSQTNRETLEARVTQDLKPIFQTWRERLPNFWDDISVWSDILAWRQHVFSAVTKVYSPLINANEPGTYGFRGFHETAWTINRFGHVARKHGLSDVCLSALGKIYALPNIEISEAFLKLREQALCLFQRPERFAEGLESISTTNLMYFANNQKAEFLTLKGMFVAKLGREHEANIAFAQAVQVDLNLPKAWAEWGRWNDRLFKDRPIRPPEQPEPEPGKPRVSEMQWQQSYTAERMGFAANAVSCYLQAAGLYKSAKARKLLVRVLWLLGVDDSISTVSRAFESYTGDVAIWYWITLIPQLLLSLTHREARHARNILMKIAKMFPQALFYHLRTSKEDFTQHHRTQTQARRMAEARRIQQLRQQQQQAHQNQQQQQSHIASPVQQPDRIVEMEVDPQERPKPTEAPVVKQEASEVRSAPSGDASESRTPVTASADDSSATAAVKPETAISATDSPANANATPQMPSSIPHVNGNVQQNSQSQSGTNPAVLANVQAVMQMSRQPQELLEEILNILKTAFPLLALSMEKMVDHINVRTKPPIEEDCYRFLSALLNEAIATWTNKGKYKDDNELIPAHIRDKVRAFCAQTKHDLRQVMYDQFVSQPITLREYIIRLQRWQERYEKALDARPKREQLDHGDCLLSDFHHSKFDDVEIPGQYIEHVDNNSGFAKITRFAPTMEVARGFCYYFRRITILGTNGRSHTFAVQSPSGRHCRREERLTQLFRILNTVLQKRKESRKRNLSIHLPAAIPLTPTLRLVTSDNSYVSLQDVFDEHCRRMDMGRDKPTLEFIDKWRQIYVPSETPDRDQHTIEYKVARMELVEEVAAKYVPENILTNYMIRTMSNPSSLWLMRKHFALQTASTIFLSYIACLSNRNPNRFHFSLKTGLIFMTELFASFDTQRPGHKSPDPVPFRLTPNMQHFITPAGIEGLLTSGVMAMARSLSNPEFDLESSLSLFLRDEISLWFTMYGKASDHPISVLNCSAEWVQRCSELAYTGDAADKNETLPITQVITSLICQATNTQLLALTSPDFQPWF